MAGQIPTRTASRWLLVSLIAVIFGGGLALLIGYLWYGFPP